MGTTHTETRNEFKRTRTLPHARRKQCTWNLASVSRQVSTGTCRSHGKRLAFPCHNPPVRCCIPEVLMFLSLPKGLAYTKGMLCRDSFRKKLEPQRWMVTYSRHTVSPADCRRALDYKWITFIWSKFTLFFNFIPLECGNKIGTQRILILGLIKENASR